MGCVVQSCHEPGIALISMSTNCVVILHQTNEILRYAKFEGLACHTLVSHSKFWPNFSHTHKHTILRGFSCTFHRHDRLLLSLKHLGVVITWRIDSIYLYKIHVFTSSKGSENNNFILSLMMFDFKKENKKKKHILSLHNIVPWYVQWPWIQGTQHFSK